jgi:hypothetical protein
MGIGVHEISVEHKEKPVLSRVGSQVRVSALPFLLCKYRKTETLLYVVVTNFFKRMYMKAGLYANIHKKQERIKREKATGKPVEKMRTPGSKGAPTAKAFAQSKKTAKK